MGRQTFEEFTWSIGNFSELISDKLYSETFIICGHHWKILIFPKCNAMSTTFWESFGTTSLSSCGVDQDGEEWLSIYLVAANAVNVPEGWGIDTSFSLTLFNQLDKNKSITKGTRTLFSAREHDCGFKHFKASAKVHDPWKGFLVDDTCVIGVEVHVHGLRKSDQWVHTEKEVQSTITGDLVDFRGLGKIEKAYVPLLEEVCSLHPSLIACQQKRTTRFTEWAFTALGRVLHFLKTKKGEDMNEDLGVLWEELQTCRFDLTWLEPYVHMALGVQSYMDIATRVQELESDMKALELEMAATAAELADARKELLEAQAQAGFQRANLDGQL